MTLYSTSRFTRISLRWSCHIILMKILGLLHTTSLIVTTSVRCFLTKLPTSSNNRHLPLLSEQARLVLHQTHSLVGDLCQIFQWKLPVCGGKCDEVLLYITGELKCPNFLLKPSAFLFNTSVESQISCHCLVAESWHSVAETLFRSIVMNFIWFMSRTHKKFVVNSKECTIWPHLHTGMILAVRIFWVELLASHLL